MILAETSSSSKSSSSSNVSQDNEVPQQRKDLTNELQKRRVSVVNSANKSTNKTPAQRTINRTTNKFTVSGVCRTINFAHTLKENQNSKLSLNNNRSSIVASPNSRTNRPLSQVNNNQSNNTAVNIIRQHRANLLRNNARNNPQHRRLERESLNGNSLEKVGSLIRNDDPAHQKLTALLNGNKSSKQNGQPNGSTNLTVNNSSTSKTDNKRQSISNRLTDKRESATNDQQNKLNSTTTNNKQPIKTPIKQNQQYPVSPSLIKPPTVQLIRHDLSANNLSNQDVFDGASDHLICHNLSANNLPNQDVFNYSNLGNNKFFDEDHCISESQELLGKKQDKPIYTEQTLSASCNRLSQVSPKTSINNLPSSSAASCSTPSLTNGLTNLLFPHSVLRNYEIGELIGEGNFAVVHQSTHKRTRRKYALKVIDKRKCAGKEAMIENEVSILRKIKHPNIVQLHEDYDYPNELYLVMELVNVSYPCFFFKMIILQYLIKIFSLYGYYVNLLLIWSKMMILIHILQS